MVTGQGGIPWRWSEMMITSGRVTVSWFDVSTSDVGNMAHAKLSFFFEADAVLLRNLAMKPAIIAADFKFILQRISQFELYAHIISYSNIECDA